MTERCEREAAPSAAKRLRVAEATMQHVYLLAATMSNDDIAAARRLGREPKLALRLSFRSSPFYRRVALLDGEVLAMWGLCADMIGDCGAAWLIVSRGARRHRLSLLKLGFAELAAMLERRGMVVDFVVRGDTRAQRLLSFFGFRLAAREPGIPLDRYELRLR